MFGIADKLILNNYIDRGSKDNKNNIVPSMLISFQEETIGKLFLKVKDRDKNNVRKIIKSKPLDLKLRDFFPNKYIIKYEFVDIDKHFIKIIEKLNYDDESLEKYFILE